MLSAYALLQCTVIHDISAKAILQYNVITIPLQEGCSPLQPPCSPLLQEDIMLEVLQHFRTRDKLQLASVCWLWRAWVANSWTSVDLSGLHAKHQLAWLANRVPTHTLKVTSSKCVCSYRM